MAVDRSSGNPGWLLTWFKTNEAKVRARTGLTSTKPLGCGHYGCVFPTNDPAWVVKITRDPTEGPMVQRIMALRERDGTDALPGIVYYKAIFHGGSVKWRGKSWPVYVIVREAVKPVRWLMEPLENTPAYVVNRSLRALDGAKQAAMTFVEAKRDATREIARQNYIDKLTDVGDAFPYISEAMFELLDEDIVLRDVHANNIGLSVVNQPRRDAGTVIIHDLGHTPTEPVKAFEPLGALGAHRRKARPSFHKELWKPGQPAWFEYHCLESDASCDAELWKRSHRRVTIVREEESDTWPGSTFKERSAAGQPRAYGIRFDDGFTATALEDELLTSKRGFVRPDPPRKLGALGALDGIVDTKEIDGWPANVEAALSKSAFGSDAIVSLSKLFVPAHLRGRGLAQGAMEALTAWADANGYVLALTLDEVWGASKARLTRFYKAHGFRMNKGRAKDFRTRETMIRDPRSGLGTLSSTKAAKATWSSRVDDPVERNEPGSEYWEPGRYTVTRRDKGPVDPRILEELPGKKGEHVRLTFPPGRHTQEHWDALVKSLKRKGYDESNPILVIKEQNGDVFIYEGNHRVRAAIAAGLKKVAVEIRYMAGSQRGGQLVIDPATGKRGPGFTTRGVPDIRGLGPDNGFGLAAGLFVVGALLGRSRT